MQACKLGRRIVGVVATNSCMTSTPGRSSCGASDIFNLVFLGSGHQENIAECPGCGRYGGQRFSVRCVISPVSVLILSSIGTLTGTKAVRCCRYTGRSNETAIQSESA